MIHDPKDSIKKSKLPTLSVDWKAYASMLDESELSDEQKREFIETIWSIVVGFIDLGFSVESPGSDCGKDNENDAAEPCGVVDSLVNHWNAATKDGEAPKPSLKPRKRSP